ncbi:hypothetical protein CEE36_00855 [candidate division TA06 bacterium B3_TA06]|uniref:Secretion system C-terminal sorting domain-containing protein n=1 Tax=candidate division TA06 bacterium B3_TA06 TaxID=2012487 RepID=A0A532VAX6_UNCT6|nr:MAG: hypothetical protein CEE36_00855 [candidate division TA06 bacterium B3_TA06]
MSDSFETYGYNLESCVALDPTGNPHVVWSFAPEEDDFYDIHYSRKISGIWTEEPVTETPERYEESEDNHYFLIDAAGYGHMVFTGYELAGEDEIAEIYYAKSTEPLESSFICEDIPIQSLDNLEICGSSVVLALMRESNVQINLYDASGRLAEMVFSGTCSPGSQSIPIEATGLSSGVYFVQARIEEKKTTAKFLLIR